jgi:uncharacterized membrane-anchored protein YhcB (DUF1043 family)
MRKFIACLLLGVLLGTIPPLLLAQQSQNTQKSNPEVETLEKRISELEKQLQTVENVEKLNLQAKLAEANAKLAEAEFGKFERRLRDSNNEWLRAWSTWFLVIIGTLAVIIGGAFWFWLRSTADRLIADEVEKNLNGFKEAVDAQNVIKSELRGLEKAHAASMLKSIIHNYVSDGDLYPEQIEALREETLLQVFEDNNYDLEIIHKAAEVLSARKFPGLVSPMLNLLNSFADSDSDIDYFRDGYQLIDCVIFLGRIETPEVHQALKRFLYHLLTDNPKHKDLFLTRTVFVLANISVKLGIGDSVSIMRKAIPYLKNIETGNLQSLSELTEYFDIFNEPEGIKEILTNHLEDEIPNMESLQKSIEDKCLELLQKYDPVFVEEWRARKMADNSKE